MSGIETEHAGYAIRYSENEDVWRCHALDLDAPKLSALKAKMNKALAEMRKAEIAVLEVEDGYSVGYAPATIVMFDPERG